MRASLPLVVLTLAHLASGAACAPEAKAPPPAPKPAAAPPPAPPPPPPVSADELPPVEQVEAEGIVIAKMVDGRVRVKTTAVWGEAIDATYDDCAYYRGALPVLQRQVSPERGHRLSEMCAVAPPPEPTGKSAKRAKAAQPASAKTKAGPKAAAGATVVKPAAATPTPAP